MFHATEVLPHNEVCQRLERCRRLLSRMCPEAGGILVFARTSIYHLTGSMGNGMLWVPLTGEPVLMVRKGAERCRLESPLRHIYSFTSYGEVAALCAEAGSPLTPVAAAEMMSLPWSLATLMQSRLPDIRFLAGDAALARCRSVKTPWELEKMRISTRKHARALHEILPRHIRPGMTERDIAHAIWDVFFAQGHMGMMRMGHHGEEIFLGRIAAGDNGHYPVHGNGPVGTRGEHPALPFMGYAGSVWREKTLLMLDTGFVHEGYLSDMSVTWWAGSPSSVPDAVQRAHACCVDVLHTAAEGLRPGQRPAQLWKDAVAQAADAGFSEGFMGLGGNKVRFLGHGIGLCVDEWPAMAEGMDAPLEENMTLALEPKIGLPGLGMVGVEEVFVVTPQGGRCITGDNTALRCTG